MKIVLTEPAQCD